MIRALLARLRRPAAEPEPKPVPRFSFFEEAGSGDLIVVDYAQRVEVPFWKGGDHYARAEQVARHIAMGTFFATAPLGDYVRGGEETVVARELTYTPEAHT